MKDATPLTVLEVVERELEVMHRPSTTTAPEEDSPPSTAAQLIALGSIWHLTAFQANPKAATPKPKRVPRGDVLVQRGDYLRIHHHPRRFPAVYNYDWTVSAVAQKEDRGDSVTSPTKATTTTTNTVANDEHPHSLPRVVIDHDLTQGWLVLNKPPNVPVHMTVDNQLENVVACLQQANALPYVALPQRLDINTSGLLLVATTPAFAAYSAQLLRNKTHAQLKTTPSPPQQVPTTTTTTTQPTMESSALSISQETKYIANISSRTGGIHKYYRCLVCFTEPPPNNNNKNHSYSTVLTARDWQSLAETGHVLRHYLEPSLRAPKRFVAQPDQPDWPECLLRIRRASSPLVVYSTTNTTAAGQCLAQALWSGWTPPSTVTGVMELEVELLTGRTHQIRGQLSASGCPIVGDVPYGGGGAAAVDDDDEPKHNIVEGAYVDADRLALQCCELEFRCPPSKTNHLNESTSEVLPREDRWNRFRLEAAWWTPLLEQYEEETRNDESEDLGPDRGNVEASVAASNNSLPTDGTSSSVDSANTHATTSTSATTTKVQHRAARPELLPPRVQLSSGRHKYVLLRATHPPSTTTPATVEWFVKSAAPSECGGPHHGA